MAEVVAGGSWGAEGLGGRRDRGGSGGEEGGGAGMGEERREVVLRFCAMGGVRRANLKKFPSPSRVQV